MDNLRQYKKLVQDIDELYAQSFKKSWEKLETREGLPEDQKVEQRGLKFGWTLLLLNCLTFIFSVVMCSFLRAISWTLYNIFKSKQQTIVEIKSPSNLESNTSNTAISKIPIMIKSPSAIRSSDTDLNVKAKVTSEKSCPNLLMMRRSGSNLSTVTTSKCDTLITNNNLSKVLIEPRLNNHLEVQCKKLREEVLKVQTSSLKEHALLSRKLESTTKEKKDIAKQLMIAQKENRAAKQQLEELLQEKTSLIKKLENATKEYKCNTKTKKHALAKLEEVTSNVEQLSLQLEQVSRDKEILQKKLKLLEVEYSKLHERYLNVQNHRDVSSENSPERDDQSDKEHAIDESTRDSASSGNMDLAPSSIANNTASLIASVSQTELDMKKIQMKIKQLEKNLENFSLNTYKVDDAESEISVSIAGNTDASLTRLADDGTEYQSDLIYSESSTPRNKFWVNKSMEIFGKQEQYSKLQAIATKMHEKVRFLGKIKENSEGSLEEESSDIEDNFSSTSDVREPTRIVSSSRAFKNFLKTLNSGETSRRSINVLGEFYF